jgi:enhancing lycopene biosynthesis protein 2
VAKLSVLRSMNPGSAGLTECRVSDTAGAKQSRLTSFIPGVWGPTSVWKARSMHSRQSSPDEDCAAAESRAHRPSGPAGSMCVLPACSTQTTKAPAGPYDTKSAKISQISVISLWKECLMSNNKVPEPAV